MIYVTRVNLHTVSLGLVSKYLCVCVCMCVRHVVLKLQYFLCGVCVLYKTNRTREKEGGEVGEQKIPLLTTYKPLALLLYLRCLLITTHMQRAEKYIAVNPLPAGFCRTCSC